ncbi:MAG: hypothetical protein AB1656_00320 [Candidatus Omnitrophota bacterium]
MPNNGHVWYVEFQYEGRRVRKSLKTCSKTIAQRALNKYRVLEDEGNLGLIINQKKPISLGEFLNALSSPIMIRIFFDLLLSVMASLLYRRFAQDLPRFENKLAPDLFRRFVDMPGRVRFDGQNFEVRFRKRAHTSILLGVKKLQEPIAVPWLEGRTLKIIFTAKTFSLTAKILA